MGNTHTYICVGLFSSRVFIFIVFLDNRLLSVRFKKTFCFPWPQFFFFAIHTLLLLLLRFSFTADQIANRRRKKTEWNEIRIILFNGLTISSTLISFRCRFRYLFLFDCFFLLFLISRSRFTSFFCAWMRWPFANIAVKLYTSIWFNVPNIRSNHRTCKD